MFVRRAPLPALLPYVRSLWVSHELSSGRGREWVLPSGVLRIVFRLTHPLRVFEGSDDLRGRTLGYANVGGPRVTPYVRDTSMPTTSVGAELSPAAGALLLGAPACHLALRHTALFDLWGEREVTLLHERLLEAHEPTLQLAVLESALFERVARAPSASPFIVNALAQLAAQTDVALVAARSGYSHKHFVEQFRRSVGLAPKLFSRINRFQRALQLAARADGPSWSALAALSGYSDQAHFTREFGAFTGLTPGRYRRLAPTFANHVPVLPRGER